MALSLCLLPLVAGCSPDLATSADTVAHQPSPMYGANYADDADVPFVRNAITATDNDLKQTNFKAEGASPRTRAMADWVIRSGDNLNMPFAIVDKVNANIYVFQADGRLYAAAPVLLGLAQGDNTAPGLGHMRMSQISPAQRTTPAGRFVATMGRNSLDKEVFWLDYENAISMHPVITSSPKERRAQRLATLSPLDNRISYGCINVPATFFDQVIHYLFSKTPGIVYVLPETR
ncbi:L,D-transpeptidase [Thiorhodovibrio frisius]|nr:L,D-transpeptidase [Thiorhodovibrio frisius]